MQRAVIVGGGIGGLSVAIALRKIGYEPHVYERAAELREVGSGMSLWPNAVRCLQEIAPRALKKLTGGNRRLLRILLKDSGGTLVKAIRFPATDFAGIGVHRAELHAALAEEVPADCIHLNHTFSGLEIHATAATVKFSNGAKVFAELVVGSDGLRSAVRTALGRDCALSTCGYVVWRGMTSVDPQRDLRSLGLEEEGDFSESYGHGQRFGIIYMGAGRVHWYATSNTPGLQANQLPLDQVFRRFASWHAPIPDLIRTSESVILSGVQDGLLPLPWSKGPVALLGDAAHPVSPNLGQGACLAIEDAVVLAAYLRWNADIGRALALYEQSRYARCREVTFASREMGRLAQIQSRALVRLRKCFFAIAPGAFTTFWLQRSWNFHPPTLATA